jgi:acyl carrier protein
MNKMEMYKKAFMETFEVSENQLNGLEYQSVPLWDSVGHMALIAVLEQSFDIMMETDDIIDLSSFEKGMEILSKNYEITF